MRKVLKLSSVLLLFLTSPVAGATPRIYGVYYIQNLPKQSLSQEEIKDLLHMREEEKLARDVYLTLSKYYSLPVFRNIAKAEEQHMRMVGLLLKKYNLSDPVSETGNRVGVFKDGKLQELYKRLVEEGKKSLINALKVGATIEDLDIKDLEEALKRTDNQDIKTVYQNLMKGSRNHMRAFVRILRRYGSDYTPQYISKAEFNRILSVKHEAGFYSSSGTQTSVNNNEITGTVVNVKKVPGFRRQNITWWAVDIQTNSGTVEVRIAPTWWYPTLNINKGNEVRVTGFMPPYWVMRGINGLMACRVEDRTTGAVYDFSNLRRWCRGMTIKDKTSTASSMFFRKSQVVTGKVISISQEPGIRRKNITWWVAELETQSGKVKVYLAPAFRFPELNVSAGDTLEVIVFIPPTWRRLNLSGTYMACEIKNLSKGLEYQVRRCP
ncbi:Protein of unknown function DUF2202 [Desulfurobacterium thermolithotrophum DSM 11699]|uniref:Uncharacterized protein n=1 Tax=Desulfurobacterium thermolithotrophum (strain DSM 11699 / BSA) TaxID=868864 RepID=F0S3U3_DESTD|nr:DUF2202 domain-containing protein [Desulfurobacterium thermolithotrophum]ADY73515.1 Protein of unknown function DUF2202 [Desulfurobacterium thermolithotrophum DSM 11699]